MRLKGALQNLQGMRRASVVKQDKLVGQARLLTRRATVYRAKVLNQIEFISLSLKIFKVHDGQKKVSM